MKQVRDRPGLLARVVKARVCYAMLAPFLIVFLIMFVIPMIACIYLSFTYFNLLSAPRWSGITNFVRLLLDDDVYMIALKNTLLFAFITGPISYLMCFIFAWIINDLKPKVRSFVTLVFYAPSISGQVYVIWRFIFSPDSYGIINGFLLRWGFIKEPLLWLQDPQMALGIVIVVQIWLSLGISFLTFIAGMQNVDRSLYESGMIDGIRNRWQELWHITLPQMKPMLLFGGLMQISSAFSVSDVSIQLAGNPSIQYSAHTLSIHALDFGFTRMEMGYAAAISMSLFMLIGISYVLFRKLIDRVGS